MGDHAGAWSAEAILAPGSGTPASTRIRPVHAMGRRLQADTQGPALYVGERLGLVAARSDVGQPPTGP